MSAKKPAENPYVANVAASNERMARVFGGVAPLMDEFTAATEEATPEPPPAETAAPKRKVRAKVEEATEKPPKLETYGVQFFPAQWEALEAEADRRKKATGSRRRDVSAVLREVVDRWIEEHD